MMRSRSIGRLFRVQRSLPTLIPKSWIGVVSNEGGTGSKLRISTSFAQSTDLEMIDDWLLSRMVPERSWIHGSKKAVLGGSNLVIFI